MGDLATTSQIEQTPQPEVRFMSLKEAISEAAAGNKTARRMVETNVRTDVIERTIKAGHILRVELETDQHGAVLQHGQTMESVQANTLRYASDVPEMRSRTQAETRNSYRIENLNRQNVLDDYNFVVFSRAADTMLHKQMADAGFFVDTMSTSIQVTSKEDDKLFTESAFVAGVAEPGGNRHDRQVVAAIGDMLGVDLDKSATETIDTPVLIRKDLMPNGVTDLYWLSESLAGMVRPYEYYLTFRERCLEREEGFQPKVDAIVKELLAEKEHIDTPVKAIERLHKISERHMVEKAIEDPTIDPNVFGPAAPHIEQARWLQAQGDMVGADLQRIKAESKAQSSSCPTGMRSTSNNSGESPSNGSELGSSGDSENSCPEVKDGQETNCPYCKKRVKAIVKDREKIYCSNSRCEAAAPEIKK